MKSQKIFKKRTLRRTLIFALVAASLLSSGCASFGLGDDTSDTPGGGKITTPPSATLEPSGSLPSNTTPSGTTAGGDGSISPEIGKYVDPLTGLKCDYDMSKVRPVAIVLGNTQAAAPQSGISHADVLIECMVEGGISRLIMITNDYAEPTETPLVIGPVRSTRDYIVSFSQAFGALMVGAGYSPTGYSIIKKYGLEYINAVHDAFDGNSCFYRDPARVAAGSYTDSLMITNRGIYASAQYYKHNYSTAKDMSPIMSFKEKVYIGTSPATHLVMKYSKYQQVQMIYSKETGTYYRYQFGNTAHLDAETGEQLNFKNVFVLFTEQSLIEGDDAGRLNVAAVGSGDGYYLTDGVYTPIKWERADDSSAFTFTTAGGNPIQVNSGKSFIAVLPDYLKDSGAIDLNYSLS